MLMLKDVGASHVALEGDEAAEAIRALGWAGIGCLCYECDQNGVGFLQEYRCGEV